MVSVAASILAELRRSGVRADLRDGHLETRPRGAVAPRLASAISQHRAAILEHLRADAECRELVQGVAEFRAWSEQRGLLREEHGAPQAFVAAFETMLDRGLAFDALALARCHYAAAVLAELLPMRTLDPLLPPAQLSPSGAE